MASGQDLVRTVRLAAFTLFMALTISGCGAPSLSTLETNLSDSQFDRVVSAAGWTHNDKIMEESIRSFIDTEKLKHSDIVAYFNSIGAVCGKILESSVVCNIKKYRYYTVSPPAKNGDKFYISWNIKMTLNYSRITKVEVSSEGRNGI